MWFYQLKMSIIPLIKAAGHNDKKKKPGFITSTYVWERNYRDCTTKV